MKEGVIKELNEFLRGTYMGIHAYENFIHHTDNPHIKQHLQQIQQDHKQHAAQVAERIQNLGGQAVDGVGFIGTLQETMSRLKGVPDTAEGIVQGCIEGEQMGIRSLEDIARGDLDPKSLKLVKQILDEDRQHIDRLQNLLH